MASKQLHAYIDEEWELEIPVSFIDCVFLLLIFFLLTARFRSLERALSLDLLGPATITPPPNPRMQEVRIKLGWEEVSGRLVPGPLSGDGTARVVIRTNNVICRDLNDLTRKLTTVTSRDPSPRVVIYARNKVPYRYVLGTVDACARARIGNVVFQAPPVVGVGGDDWWNE